MKNNNTQFGKGVEGWEYGCWWEQAHVPIKLWPSNSFRSIEQKNPCTRAAEEWNVVFTVTLRSVLKTAKNKKPTSKRTNLHSLVILYAMVTNIIYGYLSLGSHCEPNITAVSTSLIHITNSSTVYAILSLWKSPNHTIHQ